MIPKVISKRFKSRLKALFGKAENKKIYIYRVRYVSLFVIGGITIGLYSLVGVQLGLSSKQCTNIGCVMYNVGYYMCLNSRLLSSAVCV